MLSGTHYFQLTVSGLSCRVSVRLSGSTPASAVSSMFFYVASGTLTPLFPSKACGITRCPTSNPQQCFTLVPQMSPPTIAETTFDSINLSAEFYGQTILESSIVPMTATSLGQLLPDGAASFFQTHSSADSATYSLNASKHNSTALRTTPILNWTLFIRDLYSSRRAVYQHTAKVSSM